MTTFLLVRHAMCDPVGRVLAGRAPGVSLNEVGRAQAAALAERLARERVSAVYSSPLERAQETARAVAAPLGLAVTAADAFTEIDFGEWTGREWAGLAGEDRWAHFNGFRAGTRAPRGELLLEAQARAVGGLLALRDAAPAGAAVVVVSHADVLKSVVGHFLGVAIDLQHRLDISPASVTALELETWGAKLAYLNDRAHLPRLPD